MNIDSIIPSSAMSYAEYLARCGGTYGSDWEYPSFRESFPELSELEDKMYWEHYREKLRALAQMYSDFRMPIISNLPEGFLGSHLDKQIVGAALEELPIRLVTQKYFYAYVDREVGAETSLPPSFFVQLGFTPKVGIFCVDRSSKVLFNFNLVSHSNELNIKGFNYGPQNKGLQVMDLQLTSFPPYSDEILSQWVSPNILHPGFQLARLILILSWENSGLYYERGIDINLGKLADGSWVDLSSLQGPN